MKTIIWLAKVLVLTLAMYCKGALVLMTWPISLPVLLIARSNRRHQELLDAVKRH
jgi:hypothetical protein